MKQETTTDRHFSGKHLTDEGLMLYVEAMKLNRVGELPEQWYKHLLDCEWCNEEVTDLALFMDTTSLKKMGLPNYFLNQQSKTVIPSDPIALDKMLQALIAESTPLLRYERIIERTMALRSGGGSKVEVKSPKNKQLCLGMIPFKWINVSGSAMTLVLEDQKGKKVIAPITFSGFDKQYNLVVKTLQKGLYYWKILGLGAPIIGKVFVYNG